MTWQGSSLRAKAKIEHALDRDCGQGHPRGMAALTDLSPADCAAESINWHEVHDRSDDRSQIDEHRVAAETEAATSCRSSGDPRSGTSAASFSHRQAHGSASVMSSCHSLARAHAARRPPDTSLGDPPWDGLGGFGVIWGDAGARGNPKLDLHGS